MARTTGRDRVRVLRAILQSTDGRDKCIKVIQYSLRLYTFLTLRQQQRHLLKPDALMVLRAKAATREFSTFRKIIRLGNEANALDALMYSAARNHYDLARALLELINALCDDLYCLARIGLFSSDVRDWSDTWCNRIWFVSILADLQKALRERPAEGEKQQQYAATKQQLFWMDISIVKLLADLGFCCIFLCYYNLRADTNLDIDVFRVKGAEGHQTALGLVSGLIGYVPYFSFFYY